MTKDEAPEKTLTLLGAPQEQNICPFSKDKWKKAGDALVFFMLLITPVLFLIALISTRLF